MFIRIYRPKEQKELLLNTNSIWKIEVSYAIPQGQTVFSTSLEHGLNNPNAVRIYDVFIGGERIKLVATPGDPVVKVIEDIYNGAIKGETAKPDEGEND